MATTDQDLINFLVNFGGARPAAPVPDANVMVGQVPRVGAPPPNFGGQGFPSLGGAINPALAGAIVNPVTAAKPTPPAAPATPVAPTPAAKPEAAVAPPPVAASTPRRAAAPAAPAAPALIPGETGYYNAQNQLVPYGVSLAPAAGGAAGAARGLPGLPAGAANMIDPRTYFPSLVDAQMAYARRASDDILAAAGDGSQLGYSARLRALSAIYNNGLAQVGQAGGANYNSTIGSILGSQASAGATLGSAGIAASIASADRAAAREDAMERFYSTPQLMGSEPFTDPMTKMQSLRPMYGTPQRGGGFAPIQSPGSNAASKPKEGARQTYQGTSYTYTNGQWKAD